jgi:hypothetical protein
MSPAASLILEKALKSTALGLFFAAVLAASSAVADEHDEGITLNFPDKLEWKDGPPSLPKGAKIAILEGDPSKEGPFVFRGKSA